MTTDAKHRAIRAGELEPNEWGTVTFEGEPRMIQEDLE
jgi:hypothetical protein